MGLEQAGIVDVDPVLRLFGRKKEAAREHFAVFMGEPDDEAPEYSTVQSDVLGSDEFIDAHIYRIGGALRSPLELRKEVPAPLDLDRLVRSVEAALEIELRDFCGRARGPRAIIAKDLLILLAKARGAGLLELSEIIGIDTSSVSRSYDRASQSMGSNARLRYAKSLVEKEYDKRNSTQA
jgi:hypothetical protein